jgi:5'-AMP-activated protein kinase catalytic alpha subunit
MLNSTVLSEQEVCFYFKQIIHGLDFVHRNNITHRDLKPENILIDENNIIKIGDFGLSNVMKDGKLLKTFCGSYLYAAPEIIDQKKYEGTSIDIWSCGVILYFLLVKKYPFEDDSPARLYKKM